MGYRLSEVEGMTLKDAVLITSAGRLKEEDEWDRTRNLMAAVMNFSGFAVEDSVHPADLVPLSIDRLNEPPQVKSADDALELLKEMR